MLHQERGHVVSKFTNTFHTFLIRKSKACVSLKLQVKFVCAWVIGSSYKHIKINEFLLNHEKHKKYNYFLEDNIIINEFLLNHV
jgi:hypothetical protein